MVGALCAASPAVVVAQNSAALQCFYDDLGRLTKVIDPSGNEIDYVYDAVGNMLQIKRSSAPAPGSLAIFNFTPGRGGVDTIVSIMGQNFSTVAGSNAVTFNGTSAAVLSATSTVLTVTVPLGASTGPISVTVAGTTVQSSNFVVVPAILVAPVNPSVPLGKMVQFKATETLSNGSSQDVTATAAWTSATQSVATISNTQSSAGLATSVSAGGTLITATLGTISASTTLTVSPAVLVSLAIVPSNPSFATGTTVQFIATGTFTDGSTRDETTAVTWTSSNPAVATVGSGTGSVTTLTTGTTTITAAQGAVSNSTLLTVTQTSVSSVPRFALVTDLSGTNSNSTISIFGVDSSTGQFRSMADTIVPNNSSNLSLSRTSTAIDPSGQFAYILTTRGIAGFSIDPQRGTLTSMPGSPFGASTVTSTTALGVDPTGKFVLVASSDSGSNNSVAAYTIGTGGVLSPAPGGSSATGLLPLAVIADPLGKFVFVGNADGNSVSVFVLDHNNGALAPVSGSPFDTTSCGAGLSSLTTDSLGRFLYGASGVSVCAFSIDATIGALAPVTGSPFAAGTSPVWVAAEPSGKFLYVVNENSNNVSGFSINQSTGALTPLTKSPFAAGKTPVSMTVDPSGKFAYVVNQGSNNVTMYALDTSTGALIAGRTYRSRGGPAVIAISKGTAPLTFTPKFAYVANSGDNTVSASFIDSATGALTPVTNSPFATGKGPSSVFSDPAGKFLYVTDSIDNNVSGYTIDPAAGTILPSSGSPFAAGSGPASIGVDISGSFAFVANRSSNNVSSYNIAPTDGSLTPAILSPSQAHVGPVAVGIDPIGKFVYVPNQMSNDVSQFYLTVSFLSSATAPIPAGNAPVAVAVDPTGNFVYVANSGSNNISAYSITNASIGSLTQLAGSPFPAGTNPSSLTVDVSGKFLYVANTGSNDVSVYSIDPINGALTPVAHSPFLAGTKPLSVTEDVSGKFLYVVNSGSNNVSVFSIDPVTGSLTATPQSPFPVGTNPVSIYTTGTSH